MRAVHRPSLIHVAALQCALVALACATPDADGSAAGIRDSAGIRIVDNAVGVADTCLVSPTPELDLGTVEGPTEYQFHRVFDAATMSDGRIAVVDQGSSQIRIFSGDGTFERAFGSEGGGPGEFRNVFQLWVTAGDTLLVADYRPYRFSIFTPEGEFVRVVEPDPMYPNTPESVAPLADGTVVISEECCPFNGEPGEWQETEQHVVHHAADGSLIDTLAVLPNGRHGWLDIEIRLGGAPLFEASSRVAAAGRRMIVGRGTERELEVYELAPGDPTETGDRREPIDMSRPVGLIRWTGPDLGVTPAHVEAYRAAELARYAEVDNPQFRRAGEALASEERPVAERFPAHASIRLGVEGDVWVRDYPRPAEDDPGWLVFDAEGRFECRAWLPFENSWDAYEIGPDYVLGKVQDELDVEHVRRYPLTRPSS